MFLVLTRSPRRVEHFFVFIPMKSEGQKLGNLKKKILKIKNLKLSAYHALSLPLLPFAFVFVLHFFFLFLYVGPTCPFFFSWSV